MKTFFLSALLFCFCFAKGQDLCTNASQIVIGDSGFATGDFFSDTISLAGATVQPAEYFASSIDSAGLTEKSIWFKFTIPTARRILVRLGQPNPIILPGNVGFTIYRRSSCLPGASDLYSKFSPIADFGITGHGCVDKGEYLVQVTSNAAVNSEVFVHLSIDATGFLFDNPGDAQQLGFIPFIGSREDSFDVSCHSLNTAAELCSSLPNASEFTKSTWHTFRLLSHFDFLTLMLKSTSCSFGGGSAIIGYRLYRGNSTTTPLSSLVPVHDCESITTDGAIPGYRIYTCDELSPSAEYTLQLIHHNDFAGEVQIILTNTGSGLTNGPVPEISRMTANNIGDLPSSPEGTFSNFTDRFACNSRHSSNACQNITPAQGINAFGRNFNLSTFFSFTSQTALNLDISAFAPCDRPLLMRLYKAPPVNNCLQFDTSNLLADSLGFLSLNCLPPGTYTLQVSGSDSLREIYLRQNLPCSPADSCLFTNLGRQLNVSFFASSINHINQFSLSSPSNFGAINAVGGTMQPLSNGIAYTMDADNYGCSSTVLPPPASGSFCLPNPDKAIYRQFVIGDADGDGRADSGFAKIAYDGTLGGGNVNYILYSGDASSFSAAQGANSYPEIIQGLVPVGGCRNFSTCEVDKFCLVPGTYTLASLTTGSQSIGDNQPVIEFDTRRSKYGNPAHAEDLGDVISTLAALRTDTLLTDLDIFTCTDNAVSIDGYDPPNWTLTHFATKAIYREFYLSDTSAVQICRSREGCNSGGYQSLFSGRASEGLDSLHVLEMREGFYSALCLNTKPCEPLLPGWYTIVSYGSGPTFEEPLKHLNELSSQYGSYVGVTNRLRLKVHKKCVGPKYNRPHKAAVNSAGEPYLIDFATSNQLYPITSRIFRTPTEYLSCLVDTLLSEHPLLPCNSSRNRVMYYIFKTVRESYVEINSVGRWAQVYPLDVRTDSALVPSTAPVQPCIISPGFIQLCRLQAGVYTLILYGGDEDIVDDCGSIGAEIYIDSVGYSRFDHAFNAYDFGVVPPDNSDFFGKPGDINPVNPLLVPSNDFFFCTTGAMSTDPDEAACDVKVNPLVYDPRPNNALFSLNNQQLQNNGHWVRRNLWYTFVADTPGTVFVNVVNRSMPPKKFPYSVSVYRSDVDGTISFDMVRSSGLVDSTALQGLEFVAMNKYEVACDSVVPLEFNREPCNSPNPNRYYVVVDILKDPEEVMKPMSQIDVSIRINPMNSPTALYDHYSTAADLGNIGTGNYLAPTGSITCATGSMADPVVLEPTSTCSPKTLWYKFTTGQSAKLLFRLRNEQAIAGKDAVQLLKEMNPGDSTSAGLYNLYHFTSNYTNATGLWNKACIDSGTYFLLVTGCNPDSGEVKPELVIMEDEGDHCNTAAVLEVSGAGSFQRSLTQDCHTIGTGFGEQDSILSCPAGGTTANYKSSWFRIDITGTDTLDLNTWIQHTTNVPGSTIKYRLLNGDCNFMQEQVCVNDAGTINTYQCMAPGSYYVQVFVPVFFNGLNVEGDLTLRVSATRHAGFCTPAPPCAVTALFTAQYNCNTDDSVRFVNQSSAGMGISYYWDFGFGSSSSSLFSPSFAYPALSQSATYNVSLIVVNNTPGCARDTATLAVTINPRFSVNLGNDTSVCAAAAPHILSAPLVPGAFYEWQDGSSGGSFEIRDTGINVYYVTVSVDGCSASDTIVVNMVSNDTLRSAMLLCSNELPLQWNGQLLNSPGVYQALIPGSAGCDSLIILQLDTVRSPQGPSVTDITYCLGEITSPLQASPSHPGNSLMWYQTSSGGSGSADPPVPQSANSGVTTFYVSENNGACNSVRVGLTVTIADPPELGNDRTVEFCDGSFVDLSAMFDLNGFSALWDRGGAAVVTPSHVTDPGTYRLIAANGDCADTVLVELIMLPAPLADAGTDTTVVVNIPFQLYGTGGGFYSWSPTNLLNDPFLPNPTAVLQTGQVFILQVKGSNGCISYDTVKVSVFEKPGFVMPSAFTPNGDGLNDIFRPLPGKVTKLHFLRVFNRFGQMVFQSFDGSRGWDGTFRGQKQNTGTYVWVLKGRDEFGNIKTISGTVLLIRDPG